MIIFCAGLGGILYAVLTIFFPQLWSRLIGMEYEMYREMWMTVGLLKGVIGIGLLIASIDPLKHWIIILVSAIAKAGACFGFLWAVSNETFPLSAGWMVVLSDFIWLFPFALILWKTVETYAGKAPLRETPYTLEEALDKYKINSGESLLDASQGQTLTIVFLRHFGCTFTRQLLRKLNTLKSEVDENDSRLVLVHMLQHGAERAYLSDEKVARVSDPYCELYRTFGLGKGGILELFGPTVVLQGFIALFKGCGVGHLAGDGLQLPGAFLVRDGKIINAQRARTAADLPQLEKLFDMRSQLA